MVPKSSALSRCLFYSYSLRFRPCTNLFWFGRKCPTNNVDPVRRRTRSSRSKVKEKCDETTKIEPITTGDLRLESGGVSCTSSNTARTIRLAAIAASFFVNFFDKSRRKRIIIAKTRTVIYCRRTLDFRVGLRRRIITPRLQLPGTTRSAVITKFSYPVRRAVDEIRTMNYDRRDRIRV